MKRIGYWVLVMLLIGVYGCAVGPDYRPPTPHTPGTCGRGDQQGVPRTSADLKAWWRQFDDPVLNTLVDRAVAGNLDLKIALAAVREARALRGIAAADQLPTINAAGAYARVRESEN